MYYDYTLKDLIDVEIEKKVCSISDMYYVFACTNKTLEGDLNAYLKVNSCSGDTMGKFALFSIRNGEQISLNNLKAEDQLMIPSDYFKRFKEAASVEFELLGKKKSIWKTTIDKLNSTSYGVNKHYEIIPNDLPIPDFKYESSVVEKEEESIKDEKPKQGFFNRLISKFKKSNKETK